ncbi:hypothetical protein AB0F17_43425 [Nonomuraea sp. NPDC026600]|uniref:hypothetical protein n=1 Tax=Nonomuraea sp. NPDC026600 TaxID=3155363 RepID=UPI00340DDA9A
MDLDLGLGYLDITLFTLIQWPIGFTAPWWAVGLGTLALIFFLARLIQSSRRD